MQQLGRRLLRIAKGLWQWSRKDETEQRTAEIRARFWAEVREGEREAEARSRS